MKENILNMKGFKKTNQKKKKCVLALNIKAKIVTQLQRKNSLKHICLLILSSRLTKKHNSGLGSM